MIKIEELSLPRLRQYLIHAAWLLLMVGGVALASPAGLILSQGTTKRTLTLDEVEAVPTTSIDMRHPEGFEGRFAGVWLDDFLREYGLDSAPRVRFVAHDGYTTFLTPAQRREKAYLLVTRIDGEPLTVRSHGPFMLVVPEEAEAVIEGSEPMTRWIWAIREINVR
ncbi:hypothetical protein E0702_03675 [Halomonas marinisediminis]|uniref:Oxidoreductase molybdopterin-binding domain-containing protein n=1 Tax=Halomonas marinisediminis TaxID=2546095 RepID=A0ABY2D9C6_9GAMM|nr:hypothetical protein E0702_03675 [Halomonas marinisediminis]